MHLLAALGILVAIIWALVAFPSLRIAALILVVGGVIIYYSASEKAAQEQKQDEAKKQQEQAAFEARQHAYCQAEQKRWTIVPASQIDIRNPSLTQGQLYGVINDEYTVTASVKNKSKSRVMALRLNVTALDCPAQDARTTDCDVVGRGDITFDTDMPAGEVRQVNGRITLRDVPKPRGVFSSRLAVKGVRALLNESDDPIEAFFGPLEHAPCN
jgi:hypothetical protein